ncbi:MAG: Crp/Fnr family transcriptional regulator [Deltaproteobacteria bacterium]|nr:Crp/Fnr family transcriptional regulator [Deltaproteobacteria bacterium]
MHTNYGYRLGPLRAQVELLRSADLFSHLSAEDLEAIARRMSVRRWHGSAIIVGQGEPAAGLHVVFRGRAKAVLFGDSGREITLARFAPGGFFGATELLDGQASPSHVVAEEDCVTLHLAAELFLSLLERDPKLMRQLLVVMAKRVRRAGETIGNLALHDVVSRLTRTLVSIGEEQGESMEDGVMIRYRPTQQDLANMVGTCRETVSRALSALARRGLVVSKGRSLLLRHALLQNTREAA